MYLIKCTKKSIALVTYLLKAFIGCVLFVTLILVLYSNYSSNIQNVNTFEHKIVTASRVSKFHFRDEVCETIHVGFVCTGYKQTLKLYSTLKSIYYFRSKPIHFHFMVDDVSYPILETLFNTWNVPQVAVSYYNTTKHKSDMHWEGSDDYLHKNGFIKLLLSSVVPLNITKKLIVIDTDVTFGADIYELWSLFNNFSKNQFIGLAETKFKRVDNNTFKTFLDTKFDPGVKLHHLEHQRTATWFSTWTKVARYIIRDQFVEKENILNVIFKPNSTLVYVIPCEWNIKLAEVSSGCYFNTKAKIIHRNFFQHFNKTFNDENSFLSLHTMISKYSGTILEHELQNCESPIEIDSSPDTNITKTKCYTFDKDIYLTRRTLMYFRNFNYKPSENDITLTTQFSFDKLFLTEELSEKWNGPISFTMYVTDEQLDESIEYIRNSTLLNNRTNIAWNAVFKKGLRYPINDLRNVSLRTVVTPYVFLLDMDLIPTKTLYSELKDYLEHTDDMDYKVLVVPAFESKELLPSNKQEVLGMLENKTLKIFHSEFMKAYGPTNYTMWKSAESSYRVKYQLYFEPYVVVKSDVVEYDRRFIGFGFNKASHIMNLDALGYKLIVLSDLFVVHKYHRASSSLTENKKSFLYRKCKYERMRIFAKELNEKYNTSYAIRTSIK